MLVVGFEIFDGELLRGVEDRKEGVEEGERSKLQ